jgi:DNA-binding CsgD family transcriptional regulator
MNDLIDSRTRLWAIVAVVVGVVLFLGLELVEEPELSLGDLLLELVSIVPVVMTSVGVALLFRVAQRQRDEHLQVIRDLELARVQGQRWRTEARSHLDGLGAAIDVQFSRWNLTEAEREVALLLLKGLSTKEIAQVRAASERTVREQARAVYTKSTLTGRAALSAFFLEDLLAPIEGLQ